MFSLVLTYRDRELEIVKRCLKSLQDQTDQDFKVFLINYGSSDKFTNALDQQIKNYNFIDYIFVPAYGQLWNKSRAINIALKRCTTKLFCVADIDLLFHPNFVQKSKQLFKEKEIVYFKTGFLNQETTGKNLSFENSKVSFNSNKEVTGITLYQTQILKKIHGYDEFYHGWGAEDTDVHLRLKNAGYSVRFYDQEILVKHQWHPKQYRSKKSNFPFHTNLEKINHRYMTLQDQHKTTQANGEFEWGKIPDITKLKDLQKPMHKYEISSECFQFDAFIVGIFPCLQEASEIKIKIDTRSKSIKNQIKKISGKKHIQTYSLEGVNNTLLEAIIQHHRLALYHYNIDWENEEILLKIVPDA
ncbi:glycosyltransferase family 2 protein [Zunongwangia sp. HGR-M22]|uniref:glycosyltransferase family 2 protein n=1 Tax=Zunongwangia sp. HGR-M22 TaxID=3015168 RepID=UPI0022DE768B|nr:glycosyltransferase family A protein [Zunongwangia sp. HGR-M22]WBL24861.1 glycosyltransferase family A protein [Zunongwangia sp. HGR-M22]